MFERKFPGFLTPAFAALLALSAPAHADGEFFQFDVSKTTENAVLAIERGDIGLGLSLNGYDGGVNLNAALSHKFSFGDPAYPVTVKLGPAFQYEKLTTPKVGLRFVAEHYRPTSFGHVFLLGEVSTINTSYFGLFTVGFDKPDIDFEITMQGDNKGYQDQTIAATIPIAKSDIRLRGGYRIQSREAFLGFAVNTF